MTQYLRALMARLRGLFGDRNADQELDDEIEAHLRLLTERYVRQGMTEAEAARSARHQFGNVTLLKEANREMRGIRFIEIIFQDLRYGARMLRKSPGFAFVATLTLALGIGANTAIFSVVNALLLRPLPYTEPDRLLQIWQSYLPNFTKVGVSGGDFQIWREQAASFAQMAAYRYVPKRLNLTGEGEPEKLSVTYATASLFSTLGVAASHGRTFRPEEDQPGQEPVVLLSHNLWLRRFQGAPNLIGKTIKLDDQAYRVIGIMPSDFRLPDWADVWLPVGLAGDERTLRLYHPFSVIARLNPGVTLTQAHAELETFERRAQLEFPETTKGWGVVAYPLKQEFIGDLKTTLLVLFGAVAFVLLIAVANVVNLLLARAPTRQKEVALRLALGATRGRIIRQLLTESLLLALLGGLAGSLLALLGVDLLVRSGPANLPQLKAVQVDFSVFIFTFGIIILSGLAAGLLPAWPASRSNLNNALKEGGRSSTGGRGRIRLRGLLVVSEIALALMLAVGAGLLIKSFSNLLGVHPGFRPDNLLTMEVSLPEAKDGDNNQGARLFERIVERVRALPGVQAAGGANVLPVSSEEGNKWRFIVEGQSIKGTETWPVAEVRYVSLDYFQTIGIPLIKGRLFTEHDWNQPQMIINQRLAERYWPNQDPIGKRINSSPYAPQPNWVTIIGVVGNVKHFGLDTTPTLDMYGSGFWTRYLIVRASGDPLPLAAAVQNEIHSIDKTLPIAKIKTMERRLAESVAPRRFSMSLLLLFAAMGLLLSAVGIYGVMSFSVTQRTSEIGVRMALGAQKSDVFKLVIGRGMLLTLTGLAIGLVGAAGLTRLMSSLLFGVSANDPMTYSAAPVVLGVVSLLACYLPARRATKVDPLQALRQE
jgi:predicted permease